jgi:hypothetical protein
MVLAYYGIEKSRDYLALTDLGNGTMWREDVGSYFYPMADMCKHLGFGNSQVICNDSMEQLRSRIEQGRPQIISVKGTVQDTLGRSYYTGGHIMVVTGILDNGNVICQDTTGQGCRREISASVFQQIYRGLSVDVAK